MFLPNSNASDFNLCERIERVGKKPGIIKWQSNSTAFFKIDNPNRCIEEGIGSILPESVSGEGNKAKRIHSCTKKFWNIRLI